MERQKLINDLNDIITKDYPYTGVEKIADLIEKMLGENRIKNERLNAHCNCDKWHDRMEESNNICSTCEKRIK